MCDEQHSILSKFRITQLSYYSARGYRVHESRIRGSIPSRVTDFFVSCLKHQTVCKAHSACYSIGTMR